MTEKEILEALANKEPEPETMREKTDKFLDNVIGPYNLEDYIDYDRIDWDKVPLGGYMNPIAPAARLVHELEKAMPWWKELFTGKEK